MVRAFRSRACSLALAGAAALVLAGYLTGFVSGLFRPTIATALSVPAARLNLGTVGPAPRFTWTLPIKNILDGPATVVFEKSRECAELEPRELRAARVVSADTNASLRPADTSIRFPAGAWVRDDQAKTQWIVRADGSQRLISREELLRGATHADLLASLPGQARAGLHERWGLELAGGTAILAVVLILTWRLYFRTDRANVSRDRVEIT